MDDPHPLIYEFPMKYLRAAEKFIREYPNERDFCAGALLNIAALQARQDKKKAIETYQKAVDEYGGEIVPDKNANFTVANWALFRIARLERDVGNREKALAVFEKLMESEDFNTRRSSRIEYLSTKQSHLQLETEVSVPKMVFATGEDIPVSVVVRNSGKETVIFECSVRIRRNRHKTYGAISRTGEGEITLKPGGEFRDTALFTKKERLEPEKWVIDCSLNGIPFETNDKIVRIVEAARKSD